MLKAWIRQGATPLSHPILMPIASAIRRIRGTTPGKYWLSPAFAICAVIVGTLGPVNDRLPLPIFIPDPTHPVHFNAVLLFILTATAVVLAWHGGHTFVRWTLEIAVLIFGAASFLSRNSPDSVLLLDVLTTLRPIAAITFLILAVALMLNHWDCGNGRGLSRFVASIALVLGLTVAIGRAYDVPVYYLSSLGLTDMPWTKTSGLVLLAISIIWLHPDKGFPSLLYSTTLPATQLRFLLPAVLILPVTIGYFLVHYTPDFGTPTVVALAALGSATVAALVVIASSAHLSLAERALYLREHALSATNNGVFITDHQRPGEPVVWVNRAFTSLTGYAPNEVVGKSCPLWTSDMRGQEDSFNELRQSMRRGRSCAVTIRHRRRGSQDVWVRLALSPVSSRADVISHYVGVLDDVTEDHEREARLTESLHAVEQAQAAAETALAARDTFVSFVGHELRSPLNAALTWIDLLELDHSEELRQKGLEVLRQSIYTQTRLLDDLSDVATANSGRLNVQLERFDLHAMLQALADELGPDFTSRGLLFNLQLGRKPVWIDGDRIRIQQVARNLLNNAKRYNEPPAQVTLTLREVADKVTFEVSDTGIGMSPAELSHSFEPFWRGQPHKRGLGIGLAIARAIVDAHGGTVTAHSDGEGKGSSFSVTLPVSYADIADSSQLL